MRAHQGAGRFKHGPYLHVGTCTLFAANKNLYIVGMNDLLPGYE